MFFNNKLVLNVEIIELNSESATVKGLPFWFTFKPSTWTIPGTGIDIIDYIGTLELGILYFSKPVDGVLSKNIKTLNITYKN